MGLLFLGLDRPSTLSAGTSTDTWCGNFGIGCLLFWGDPFAHFSTLHCATHAVWCALLGAHAYRMPTGACNLMLCPMVVYSAVMIPYLDLFNHHPDATAYMVIAAGRHFSPRPLLS